MSTDHQHAQPEPSGSSGPLGIAACCWSVLLSTSALLLITAGQLAAGIPLDLSTPRRIIPSITDCVLTPDGRHALVTYRQFSADREATREWLASLDMSAPRPELAAISTSPLDQELASLRGGQLALAVNTKWIERREIMSGRCISSFGGHDRTPEFLAVAQDGRWLATCVSSHVRITDLETKQISWQRDDLPVTSMRFSPQGKLICALHETAIVEISPASPEIKRTILRCSEPLYSLAIDPRGVLLACLYSTGRIEMRALATGRLLWSRACHGLTSFPAQHRLEMLNRTLVFSPDGRDLVTTASEEDWVLAIWDVHTGERVQTLRGHDKIINGATYLPDGTLVSWSADGTLRFWDVPRGFARRVISLRSPSAC